MIYSLYNNSISVIILALTLALSLSIFKKNNQNLSVGILIFLWHFLFVLIHYYYSLFFNYASDSYTYYHSTLSNPLSKWFTANLLNVGSNFIKNFVYIFHSFINLSYFNVFLLFSMLGNLGLIYLYIILIEKIKKSYSIFILTLILLPSMSFWICGINKDVIVFFGIIFFLWNLIKEKNINLLGISISIFLIFLVRPHMAIILLLCIFFGLIIKFKKRISEFLYLFLCVMLLPFLYFQFERIYGLKINFSSVNLFFESISGIIDNRQLLDLNSSLSLETMSFIEKYFTYFFRPLPYEVNNFFQLYISIENTFLLLILFFLFIFNIKTFFKNIKKLFNYKLFIIILYVATSSYLLSYTTSNLGISSRQKFMVLPFIFFIITYFFSNNKLELNTK